MKRALMIRISVAFILAACILCPAFADQRELPKITLTIGETKVVAEMALTDSDRAKGLGGRKFLGADKGMLFVFDFEHNASFWMKDTLIPLDIAFIDKKGAILQIETMTVVKKGEKHKHYRSKKPVKYGLEVNAGWFKKHKVQPGLVIPELAD